MDYAGNLAILSNLILIIYKWICFEEMLASPMNNDLFKRTSAHHFGIIWGRFPSVCFNPVMIKAKGQKVCLLPLRGNAASGYSIRSQD